MRSRIVVAALAVAFVALPCAGQTIEGPDKLRRDHLGTFKLTGAPPKSAAWFVMLPPMEADQFRPHAKGGGFDFVGPPAKYTVHVFGTLAEGAGQFQLSKTFEVYEDGKPIPPPTPPPGPPPGPPQPPNPSPDLSELAGKVYGWAKKTTGDATLVASEAGKLAAVFDGFSSKVSAGVISDPAALFKEIRTANNAALATAPRQAAWKPWSDEFGKEAAVMVRAGSLANKTQWAAALAEVAKGLKAAAG